jgi:hypothetical protein
MPSGAFDERKKSSVNQIIQCAKNPIFFVATQ